MNGAEHRQNVLWREAEGPPEGHRKRPPSGGPRRTLEFLRAEFPVPHQPKMVAVQTGQSHAAVKKWLQRNEGVWVTRELYGFYRARATPALLSRIGIEPVKLHGIRAHLMSPDGGTPPALGGLGDIRRNRDGSTHRVAEWHGRRVVVQADGWVSVRASMEPLGVAEFMELAEWLQGLAGGGRVVLDATDLAVDYPGHRLRMKGVECMELQTCTAAMLKLYNKRALEATRIEACMHRVNLSFPEAAELLHAMSAEPADFSTFTPNPSGGYA